MSKIFLCGLATAAVASNVTDTAATTQLVSGGEASTNSNLGVAATNSNLGVAATNEVVVNNGNSSAVATTTAPTVKKQYIEQTFEMKCSDLSSVSDANKIEVAGKTRDAVAKVLGSSINIDWLGLRQNNVIVAQTGTKPQAARLLLEEAVRRALSTTDTKVEYVVIAEDAQEATAAESAMTTLVSTPSKVGSLNDEIMTSVATINNLGLNFTAAEASTPTTPAKTQDADPTPTTSGSYEVFATGAFLTITGAFALL